MLKMTVNVDDENLKTIRELLGREADSLGIRFEFKPVNIKLMELTCESLNCDSEDILAVNFAFNLYKMPDESVSTENPRDTLSCGILYRLNAKFTPKISSESQFTSLNSNPIPKLSFSTQKFSDDFQILVVDVHRQSRDLQHC